MKLIYLGQELDTTKEHELLTDSEFGFKVDIKMTEESLLTKMILQESLVLSQKTLQSTLFHTQIFALRKKVSLLIKAML